MSVIFIDEINNDFHQRVLFFSAALGYHKGESHKSIVSYAF